jgi:hypothetical protein
VRVLSLRQPWAHAVLHYGKTIENRRWNTRFRGEFLIHAAKGMTAAEYEQAEDFIAGVLGWGQQHREQFRLDFRSSGHRGGIVGQARLVGVVPPRNRPIESADVSVATLAEHKGALRWHMPDQYGFILADVRPTLFVPCRGALGFFDDQGLEAFT